MDSKPTRTRTRDGCLTCRRRKKKCDSVRPQCENCLQRGLQCEGYGTKIIWPDSEVRVGMSRRGPSKASQTSPSRTKGVVGKKMGRDEPKPFSWVGDLIATPSEDQGYCSILVSSSTDCGSLTQVCSSRNIWGSPKNAFSPEAPAMIQTVSFLATNLTSTQQVLFDHYIHKFSVSYPTCTDSSNPFLAVYVPLALRNPTAMYALLTLSGTQIERRASFEMKQEILNLKGLALRGCRKLLESLPELDSASPEEYRRLLESEDCLGLVVSVILLILYDKLSGEAPDIFKPHLKFINRVFAGIQRTTYSGIFLQRSPSNTLGQWGREYEFLYSEFMYNDLLTSMASSEPTIGKYDMGDDQRTEGPVALSSLTLGPSRSRYLQLISKIVNGHTEVSLAHFDEWDGRLDWIPSLCFSSSQDNDGITAATAFDIPFSIQFESLLLSSIYRDAGKLLYIQRRCPGLAQSSRISPQQNNGHCSNIARQHSRTEIGFLVSNIIRNLKLLPIDSRYESSILWPLGVISESIFLENHKEYVLLRAQSLDDRFGMRVFERFKDLLTSAWKGDILEDTPACSLRGRLLLG